MNTQPKSRHLAATLWVTVTLVVCGCSNRSEYKEITADPEPVKTTEESAAENPDVDDDSENSSETNSAETVAVNSQATEAADSQIAETEDQPIASKTPEVGSNDISTDGDTSTSEADATTIQQVAKVDSDLPQTLEVNQSARTPEEEMALMRARLGFDNPGTPLDLTRELKLLIPHKELSVDEKTGAIRLTFDDIDLLKVLNIERPPTDIMEHLPYWIEELDGKKVTLRGWMYPTFNAEGIGKFLFVRDNGTCCFGPNAKIYDKVGVTLQEGKSTSFIQGRPFDVTGTFVLDAWVFDDELELLYHIEDAVISKK